MEGSLVFSRQEIEEFHAACGFEALNDPVERRTSERWLYPETQLIGAYGVWGLPPRQIFRAVRCHDISKGGVSFFLPRPPAFELAVIEVGKQPIIDYLLMQLVHYGEQVDAEKLYLVGCQFVERVTIQTYPAQPR